MVHGGPPTQNGAPEWAAPSVVGYARGPSAVSSTTPTGNPAQGYGDGVVDLAHPDPTALRALAAHEARVHARPGRQLRDLGDGLLLHDPVDPEPFWNRLVAPEWPDAAIAFERRLDEIVTLFATLGRLAHVRPLAYGNRPSDLVRRLRDAGFAERGADAVMMLVDPTPALAASTADGAGDVRIERIHLVDDGPGAEAASDAVAAVLSEAFGVDAGGSVPLAVELRASLADPASHTVLVRVGDVPAAVARRATFDGMTYLSSIGTRPRFRHRGLGTLAAAAATVDGVAAGSRWVHLTVNAGNGPARTMYERLGFRCVGEPAPDLLLER